MKFNPFTHKCPDCMHVIYREENKTADQTVAVCEAVNSNGCDFFFTTALFAGESGDVLAFLQLQEGNAKEICKFYTLGITLGLFAAIVLIGLLTFLFYKCYIVIDDRRQYAAYLKEEEMLRYATNHNANAMYRSPITTYRNPTYGKAMN